MPSLVESLSRFMGRVEILARGAEAERRAAEIALEQGRPLEARALAREILEKVPSSPLGLALWADAAESAWLDHEAADALSELAKQLPWRADIWLRLGRVRLRLGDASGRELLERAVSAPDERPSARLALLDLADLDLAAFDFPRASRWLDRVPLPLTGIDRDLVLRRAECALGWNDTDSAKTLLEKLGTEGPEEVDPRRSLARARLTWQSGQAAEGTATRAETVSLALRALIMEVPGAKDFITAIVAATKDRAELTTIKEVCEGLGLLSSPSFSSAFAFAEGRKDDARSALVRGIASGDERAAHALLWLATETRDLEALRLLKTSRPSLLSRELDAIASAAAAIARGDAAEALETLDPVGGEASAWASELRSRAMRLYTAKDFVSWHDMLSELHNSAHALSRLDVVGEIEGLAMEQKRPLRLAIVGEFNAGKSTFINALLGTDVAPTGVLPTTATLHWVAWAPDPFARVVVRAGADRVVPHAELKNALAKLQSEGSHIERVYIYAPIERLRHVEILDTPGFNAPDPEHAKAARSAFDEAHVVLWLLDAAGAMKASEVAVMSEVRDLGIPTLVFLNKADRLKPDDLAVVKEHVERSLVEAKLPGYRPPLALSARLALKGRLSTGDEAVEALQASHFSEVEGVLEEAVVDRADVLREQSLRRKARDIARQLLADAQKKHGEEQSKRQAALGDRERLRQAASKLQIVGGREEDRAATAALINGIEQALEPARRTLAHDLSPLGELSPEAQREPGLLFYVAERFTYRLTLPIAEEIAKAASTEAREPIVEAVRAALVGASSLIEQVGPNLGATPLGPVIQACLSVSASALLREAARPVPELPSAITVRRIEAAFDALNDAAGGAAHGGAASPGAEETSPRNGSLPVK